MRKSPLILVAACALIATGCSATDSSDAASTSLDITRATPFMDGGVCPDTDPPAHTDPQWTVIGATGQVAVAASTEKSGPLIKVTTPLTVNETQVKTLVAGDGDEITEDSSVNVCYEGVNGRDGQAFDSSYQRGTPQRLRPDSVIPGFRKALLGQRVGAGVAVVMTPEDGYVNGTPDGTIAPGDTLVFVFKIMAAEQDSESDR